MCIRQKRALKCIQKFSSSNPLKCLANFAVLNYSRNVVSCLGIQKSSNNLHYNSAVGIFIWQVSNLFEGNKLSDFITKKRISIGNFFPKYLIIDRFHGTYQTHANNVNEIRPKTQLLTAASIAFKVVQNLKTVQAMCACSKIEPSL